MEEEKKTCCNGKVCEGCGKDSTQPGCCNMKHCHMIKVAILAVVIIITFVIGTQVGEMRANLSSGGDYETANNDFASYLAYRNAKKATVSNQVVAPVTTPTVKTNTKK